MFSRDQYLALRQSLGLLDRSDRGRLRLTGEDRRAYLQGLLTNDIEALRPGTGCYAVLLTAQGRMISDMYVIETGAAVVLDLERAVTAKVAAHLERFIFSEDVQVSDESATLAQLGVYGPHSAAAVAGAVENAVPEADLAAMKPLDNRAVVVNGSEAVVVCRDDIGVRGFDVLLEQATAQSFADRIRAAGARAVSRDTADVVRIEAGVPMFLRDMDEETIPLEAGIEHRAISLTKGCYVGQEIIIRVLHRGHGRVARRLVGLTLEPSDGAPSRGARLHAGDRDVGVVTSATFSPALNRQIALGYVHRDFAEAGTLLSVRSAETERAATVSQLPFVGPKVTVATDS